MTKRNLRNALFPLLLAIAMLFTLPGIAFAADKVQTQCVTVKQSVSGTPSKTTYTYYLMPMEKGNPMPTESDGGKLEEGLYKFTLKGTDSAKFHLKFTEPGTYNYELRRTEPVPDGDTVSPTVHPFGYKVKADAEGNLEIIPFTCYDVYMEIVDDNGKPLEIVLNTTLEKPDVQKGDKGDPGEKGDKGEPGEKGEPGTPGVDGKDGQDGQDGKDGVNGADGKNGTDGVNGVDGKNGTDGVNGKDGKNGTNGTNGKDGKTVTTTNVVTRTVNKIVNTGDPYQIGLWLGLIVLSAGGLVFLGIVRRRKERNKD